MNEVERIMTRPRRSATPLRKGVYLLPNLITTFGLFTGFYSIICTFRADFMRAAIAIIVANLFDALDGRVARFTNATSRFGIEYDSLSDLVAFGVAPAILVYRWALEPYLTWGWLAAQLYVTCGALRLARFNVQFDNAEKRHFVGLPIPAAAEVIATTVLLQYRFATGGHTFRHVALLLVTYALAALMVSNLKFFSFKETELYRRQPFGIFLGGIVLLILVIAEPQIMLFGGFFLYACSGPLRWLFVRGRRVYAQRQRRPRPPDGEEPPGNASLPPGLRPLPLTGRRRGRQARS